MSGRTVTARVDRTTVVAAAAAVRKGLGHPLVWAELIGAVDRTDRGWLAASWTWKGPMRSARVARRSKRRIMEHREHQTRLRIIVAAQKLVAELELLTSLNS